MFGPKKCNNSVSAPPLFLFLFFFIVRLCWRGLATHLMWQQDRGSTVVPHQSLLIQGHNPPLVQRYGTITCPLHCLFIRLKCCTFIYVFWDWLYEVQSFILWCPNDETIHCCSNLGYTDSLPLRPDWIPFTTMLLPFVPRILNEYFDLTRYTSFSCQPGRFL